MDTVNKAGRKSEKAYQLAKASAELKRDLETILLANQGRSAGTSTIARKLGSILSWIKTNSDKASDGADPATIGVSTRTDGTVRTFTEALLKTVVAEVFVSGGSPKILAFSILGGYFACLFWLLGRGMPTSGSESVIMMLVLCFGLTTDLYES